MRDATALARPATGEPSGTRPLGRMRLVRRVVLFQVKLFADGVRDVVMSPLSIAAGVLGILSSRDPEGAFDRLMRFGRETDRWINLFDAYGDDNERGATLDGVADEIETAIRRDYARGGMSARSAEALLGLAGRLRRRS